MAMPVVERLESLSNYEPLFAAGSESAGRNPISWAHWRIPVGARTRSVLSRVAFVKSDFSGRPGKFAHHLVLEPGEQAPAGPAWMMMQPGMMEEKWTEEPMMLPPRPVSVAHSELPTGSHASGGATRLANAFIQEPDKAAYIVYEPDAPLLPVLNEAIGLLPPALRWQVTFNTYFAELPAGLSCTWRCVVASTPLAIAARKSKIAVIDLSQNADGK